MNQKNNKFIGVNTISKNSFSSSQWSFFFWNKILQPQIKNNKDKKKKLSMPLNSSKTKLQNSLLEKKNQNSWNVSSNTSDTLSHFVE